MKKNKLKINLKITIFLLVIMVFTFSQNISANLINSNNNEVTIFGTVKEAVTCIPNPVENVKVNAIKIGFFPSLFHKSNDYTNKDGEYEINLQPGIYIIYCKKNGYRSFQPRFFYLKKFEAGSTYNLDFLIKPL